MSQIFGAVLNYQNIINLMQQKSTRVHKLSHELLSTWNLLVQIADNDLKEMISKGSGEQQSFDPNNVSSQVDAEYTALRDWQYAVKNYSDNYFGTGSLSDCSYHCAKRTDPLS